MFPIAASPTFLIAERPNLIFVLFSMENSESDLLISGGRTSTLSLLHSNTAWEIFSFFTGPVVDQKTSA